MGRLVLLLVALAGALGWPPHWARASSLPSMPNQLHPTFLSEVYASVEEDRQHFLVRQVPGDGGCLFHALTVCLDFRHSEPPKRFCDFDAKRRRISNRIRKLAVEVLQRDNETLVMDNQETISSSQLLSIVAQHYNTTTAEYCRGMAQPGTWGGGPEIVAVCNHLRRPIHVYELAGIEAERQGGAPSASGRGRGWGWGWRWRWGWNNGDDRGTQEASDDAAAAAAAATPPPLGAHCFKLCAKFGSPAFDAKAPLHLLCADGRFPEVAPRQAKKVGDHFLALFPCDRGGQLAAWGLADARGSDEGGKEGGKEGWLRAGVARGGGGGGGGGGSDDCEKAWWDALLESEGEDRGQGRGFFRGGADKEKDKAEGG